jgi:SHS2 domain-containing protein
MYRWAEHIGELALELEAATEEAVYTDAVRAMAELLAGDDAADPGTPPVVRELALQAPDRARLLAELLGELAFMAEIEGFVPSALDRVAAGDRALEASVRGRIGDPPHLVKAVTYHRLAFDRAPGGWRASVILDV